LKKIGLTLGAGGARGLAHIVILEAFEELGIKPSIVSGTSIGAIIGAAYCAGLDTSQMKESLKEKLLNKSGKLWEIFKNLEVVKLLDFVDVEIKSGGFIKGEKFIKYFSEELNIESFEELKIPLKVVATNFLTKEQSVFDEGKLFPAVKASYSLPGLFSPVQINKNLFVDGGLVNPLPYDIFTCNCDISIAIDVQSNPKIKTSSEKPKAYEVFFTAFQILQQSIVKEKLKISQPDILIKTDIKDIRVLEFLKAKEIYKQSYVYKEELKRKLDSLL
jgi:NTE family protein